MSVVIDGLSWLLLVAGGLLVITGGIGILRMPDVYTRAHAAGITDTMGAGLLLIGMMLQGGATIVTIKLALILVFILFTSPASSHALIHTVHANGIEPILADRENGVGRDGDPGANGEGR